MSEVSRPLEPSSPVRLASDAPTIGDVLTDPLPMLPTRELSRQASVRGDAGLLGDFWLAAASTTGRSHLSAKDGTGTTGQDSFSYVLSADGSVAIVAVADGLGSCSRSHLGAIEAVHAACEHLSSDIFVAVLREHRGASLEDPRVASSLEAIRSAVAGIEPARDDPGAVSTTLIAACIDLHDPGRSAVFVRFGDSNAFVIVDGHFVRKTVFPAKFDGPANQVSASLPRSDIDHVELFHIRQFPPRAVLVLASDGVADDIGESPALRTWLSARWSERLDSMAMVDSLAYRRRGSNDDRTALCLHLDPVASGPDVLLADEGDDASAAASSGESAPPSAPAAATWPPPEASAPSLQAPGDEIDRQVTFAGDQPTSPDPGPIPPRLDGL